MRERSDLLKKVRLYLITDRRLSRGRSEIEVVKRALSGGVDMVQYREKHLPDDEFKQTATELLKVTRRNDIPLIINDRVEIAAEIDADGVHLGQKDLDCKRARGIIGENKVIGVSASNSRQALRAIENGADYLGLGPIYQTDTKEIDYPRGIDIIKEVRAQSPVPIFAIGGINLENVGAVLSAGASGVAVISAIVSADQIGSTCCQFVAEIQKSRT
jgi:thiamine-phosphate pyrophosphorylase